MKPDLLTEPEQLASAAIDLDFEQHTLAAREQCFTHRSFDLGTLCVQVATDTTAAVVLGASPNPERCGLFLWDDPHGPVINGAELPAIGSVLGSPGREISVVWRSPHRWAFISCSRDQLTFPEHHQLISQPHGAARLWDAIDRYVAAAGTHSTAAESAAAGTAAQAQFLERIEAMARDVEPSSSAPLRLIPEVVTMAVELIHDEHVDSVSELAARCHVSRRTLARHFKATFDVSPRRYMQVVKLHRGRRLLLEASPDDSRRTVAGLVAKIGVWDPGRFAQRYREVFGESPRDTLRSRAPASPRRSTAVPSIPRQCGSG